MTATQAPHTVQCPSCESWFPIAPERVPEEGVAAICSHCMRVFRVERPVEAEADAFEVDTEAEETADAQGISEAEGTPDSEAIQAVASDAVAPESAPVEVEDAALETVDDIPAVEAEPTDVIDAEEPLDAVGDEDTEADRVTEADFEIEVEPAEPTIEVLEEDPELEPMSSDSDADLDPTEAAVEVREDEAPSEPLPEPIPEVEETRRLETEETVDRGATGEASPVREQSLSRAAARFGRRDPHDRAKRLARVLVSDMLTYHPARYEEALAEGTLKEHFEDEIRLSWEEYEEQIGRDLAESTDYFIQALNEILARGERLFQGIGRPE